MQEAFRKGDTCGHLFSHTATAVNNAANIFSSNKYQQQLKTQKSAWKNVLLEIHEQHYPLKVKYDPSEPRLTNDV